MKSLNFKILFILLLSISTQSIGQIFLDYSLKDVKSYLDEEGLIITDGWTEEDSSSFYYVSGSDKESSRFYYFDRYNKCVVYVYTTELTDYDANKYLIDNGYYKIGEVYYNTKYKVRIESNKDTPDVKYIVFTKK